ncbi:leucine-rich_repeat domain-containing protein [Hexamita inflata]|uniref:Leucine-rich repeat domain-containing protein n=1 Tax=Hexamita inflata TaxID=28002 RepID=A0AA86TRN8_9EUKA|nr:leucine-rich repeat domain-containing protein [Hexamita inflata]
MKNLKELEMYKTKVVDLHPLQYLCKLKKTKAYDACIIDVSPLSKLTQLNYLDFRNNQITNAQTQTLKNFSKYEFSNQKVPTTDELKFYNKILSVHNSHKQIRKISQKIRTIQNDSKVSKLRTSLTQKKNYVYTIFNNQIMAMNKEVDMLVQFIQNSTSYLD